MADSQWTLDTLKEHLGSRIDGLKENVTSAMAAADKAVTKAETAAEKRFDSVNEFRDAMKDQQATFANKEQTEQRFKTIETSMERARGAGLGISIAASIIAGIIASMAAVATIEVMLRHP